ncbi:ATP phosphoribosyltransferase [Bacillus sp. TS-2]|nr:ATP phosphoribosyltransferase [Bacillus sp. TS-2]
MSKPFMFEKPLGMRDTLPVLYETKNEVKNHILSEIEKWGYRFIETPTLEYYDTVGLASATLDQQLFKLLDSQGRSLVLRPDMTAPIARLVASSLKDQSYPIRLAYQSTVFRAQQHEAGKPAEFDQLGIELLGDGTVSSDGEVISLMISSLEKSGLTSFQVAIGHVGFLKALLLDVVGNEERAEVLRRFLYEKNYVGFKEHVKSLSLSSIDKSRLLDLLKLRGGKEILSVATEIVQTEDGKKAVAELKELFEVLECYDLAQYVKFDLNIVLHMSYYTGIIFEGYGEKLGVPLSSGGRYDELLEKFNRPAQATGFGIRLDLLVEALGEMSELSPQSCIIFSRERRDEAVRIANEKRNNGEPVVLQDLAGIEDVDLMTEQFDEVLYFIGKPPKGGAIV